MPPNIKLEAKTPLEAARTLESPSKRKVILSGGRMVEYETQAQPYERLRLMVDTARLTDYQRLLFDNLFPENIQSHDFEPKSVEEMPETKLTNLERDLRNAIRRSFGFERIEKTEGTGKLYPLHVKFTDSNSTLAYRLNHTPWFTRLHGLSMFDARVALFPPDALGDRIIISRAEHSQFYASSALHTLLRYAIKDPQLFIHAVENDLAFYTERYSNNGQNRQKRFSFHEIPFETKSIVDSALKKLKGKGENPDNQLEKALHYAVEYGKLFIIYAYLHDKDTPALGDRFMKAKARFTGQETREFNEDKVLAATIGNLISHDWTQLPQILKEFKIDPELLITMVKCLASDQGWGLAASILKDKRRWTEEFAQKYPFLPKSEAMDHDQVSGTITNMQVLADELFPGGFRFLERTDLPPIGSFEERLRIFAYMLATGMTKDELEYNCKQLEIPPEQLFFAANEVSIGPNTRLQNISFIHDGIVYDQILPVALSIGDVSKAFKALVVLYAFNYRGPVRAPAELFIQDAITCGFFGDDEKTPDSKLPAGIFLNRTDGEALSRLSELTPLIPYILYKLHDQARVVSEQELTQQYIDGRIIKNCLVADIKMESIIPLKTGTLVRYEGVEEKKGRQFISTFDEAIKYRLVNRDTDNPTRSPNPNSFFNRTLKFIDKIPKQRWFAVIPLSSDFQVNEVLGQVTSTPTEAAMRRALGIWTQDVSVGDRKFSNPLHEIFAKT